LGVYRCAPSRRALISGAALALTPLRALAQGAATPFLVVGDWGERSGDQNAVAAAMGDVAAAIGSRFVISTGDNFYTRGVTSVEDPQWTETFERVFAAPSLQTPWYAVLGNHDYRGSVSAEVNYTITSARWRMPARYWAEDMILADGATATFFFLDTFPLTHLPGMRAHIPIVGDASEAHAQLRWLEENLAACASTWKIAVGHHPVLSSGSHGASPALRTHLKPLFERYGVRAYFNGHDHNLEHLSDAGVDYICSGAGSESRPLAEIQPQSRFADRGPGFAACALNGDAMGLRFHDGAGAVLYETSITR